MNSESDTFIVPNVTTSFTSFTALIIVTFFIIAQFVYEYYYESFFGNESFVRAVDVTRSEAGRPITEIIIDF